MTAIIQDRLDKVTHLSRGAHPESAGAMCAMEAAAWIAGETWSDKPQCVCPVIAIFARRWNDDLPDAERDALLLPLLPRLVGTRSDAAIATRRKLMAADWLVRVHTPAWLRLAKLEKAADALSGLPEITGKDQILAAAPILQSARDDAGAAWNASWVAAGLARGLAVPCPASDIKAAAWEAARRAASPTAWFAAWFAAFDAAGAAQLAAGDAAGDALTPTRRELQESARALLIRMAEVGEH